MANVVCHQFVKQQRTCAGTQVRSYVLQRTCSVVIFISFCLTLAAAQNPAEWCRSGHFALFSEAAGFSLARITTPRSHFYGDETTAGRAGCPSDDPTCQLPSYVIQDDIVVANGKTYGQFSCVRYVASTAQSTTGWLETASLEPTRVTPSPDAWQGSWSTYDNTLVVSKSTLDRGFIVEGEAYWHGLNTVHIGEIVARAEPFDNQLVLFGAYDCQLNLTLLQDYLIAQDNKRCGGMNVTFDGVYTRQ